MYAVKVFKGMAIGAKLKVTKNPAIGVKPEMDLIVAVLELPSGIDLPVKGGAQCVVEVAVVEESIADELRVYELLF